MADGDPTLRRMHFNREGKPKTRPTPDAAKRARDRGQRTYLCPVCGGVHCGGRSA